MVFRICRIVVCQFSRATNDSSDHLLNRALKSYVAWLKEETAVVADAVGDISRSPSTLQMPFLFIFLLSL